MRQLTWEFLVSLGKRIKSRACLQVGTCSTTELHAHPLPFKGALWVGGWGGSKRNQWVKAIVWKERTDFHLCIVHTQTLTHIMESLAGLKLKLKVSVCLCLPGVTKDTTTPGPDGDSFVSGLTYRTAASPRGAHSLQQAKQRWQACWGPSQSRLGSENECSHMDLQVTTTSA